MDKPSTIATCPGKLRTLNVPLKTLILDGYNVAVMLFLIMQESIKSLYTLFKTHKKLFFMTMEFTSKKSLADNGNSLIGPHYQNGK